MTETIAGALTIPAFLLIAKNRRVFDCLVFIGFALFSVSVRGGYNNLVVPGLLLIGLATGHLSLKSLRLPSALLGSCLTFLILFAISNWANDPVPNAIQRVIANMLFVLFLPLYFRSKREVVVVFGGLAFGFVVSNLMAILVLVGVWNVPAFMFHPYNLGARYQGLIGDPNFIAPVATPLAIWLTDETIHPTNLRIHAAWKIALVAMMVVLTIATMSRSGVLNLMVGGAVYLWWALREMPRPKAVKLGVGVAAFSLALWFGIAATPLSEIVAARVDESTGRDMKTRGAMLPTLAALTVAQEHPFGVGSGRTSYLTPVYENSPTGEPMGSHNAFVQVLSDNGWPGFVALIAVVVQLAAIAARKMQTGVRRHGLALSVVVASAAGLAVEAFFHDLIQVQFAWLVPSMLVAVLFSAAPSPAAPALCERRKPHSPHVPVGFASQGTFES